MNIKIMSRGGMKKLAAAPRKPQFKKARYVVSNQVAAPKNQAMARKN
jgi:hypothetical protein